MTKKTGNSPQRTIFYGSDTGAVEYHPNATPDGRGNAISIDWTSTATAKPRGRPVEKDWQGALRWLIAKVARDGLPTERGGRKEVLRWMEEWFADQGIEAGRTQIEEQIRLIYQELEAPRREWENVA